ncbi:MAG: hypothetical protein LBH98_00850 [Chitinispirillales bacterium]|jgi:hypothetical protein|nr:hypothetical protein [Chitinispirillales bacterium]
MRINEIVRLQEYMRANGREDYDVIKELLGKVKKKDEDDDEDKVTASAKKAIKDIVQLSGGQQNTTGARPPMFGGDGNFNGIWTKIERTMSDEEIHKAHKDLAVEYADKAVEIGNSGKSRSMIANELLKLDNWYQTKQSELAYQYVCVFSPDRKAAYAQSDGYIVELNEPLAFGNSWTMLWGPSGWSMCPTPKENERYSEFMKTHFDTLNRYEAEHGQIPYWGQYSNRVITPAPVKNYY